jgi:hypothetical protein
MIRFNKNPALNDVIEKKNWFTIKPIINDKIQ